MDVSFVIPARNEQHTLRYTVANLYATLTRHSFEIIVIDDDSAEPLSGHLDPDRRVVYLRNRERLGVAKSRNIGARQARGDLLVFLDAHVCFAAGWLEAVYREEGLLRNGILTPAMVRIEDLAQFRALSTTLEDATVAEGVAPGSRQVHYGYFISPLPTPAVLKNFARPSRDAFTVPVAGGAALCVTRELFFRLGAFEDELAGFGIYEDVELCMRAWSFGHWVAVMPSVQCVHFKARRSSPIDYRSRPFHTAHDQSVENALRVYYLHLPDRDFEELVGLYKDHPGFTPDLQSVVTDSLKQRKGFIRDGRVHDWRWLQRRLYRVGP
jgi:glycosyltransferase involved in cell wall biosynthesis